MLPTPCLPSSRHLERGAAEVWRFCQGNTPPWVLGKGNTKGRCLTPQLPTTDLGLWCPQREVTVRKITASERAGRSCSCEEDPPPAESGASPQAPARALGRQASGAHLLRLNWIAKSVMTCRALLVSCRSMEMVPAWRVKVPEISNPLAFMAGSQT